MILVIRRMVLLVSLMFWQGGFMFYGGVVVPVGGRILGSYILTSSVQWLTTLALLFLAVLRWNRHDNT